MTVPESAAAVFEAVVEALFHSRALQAAMAFGVPSEAWQDCRLSIANDVAEVLAAQLATALAQPDTLGGGGVFERFPDAFDDRQRPVCGVWNPLLGPCVCGNPDGHTTQPSATSERGGQ